MTIDAQSAPVIDRPKVARSTVRHASQLGPEKNGASGAGWSRVTRILAPGRSDAAPGASRSR